MDKNPTIIILKNLIKVPSYYEDDCNESALIDFILNFIKQNTKYKYVVQKVDGDRKNILVFNKPNPKIALFGHMDTVLPKADTKNPFTPRIIGNKIYGLGAVDMKSGLAIMLNLAQEISNDDLAFIFSVDEEYEFKGAQKLKNYSNFKPKFIINLEPTDNKILNGCRGITEFSFIVHGKSVHAGRKIFGINAIEKSVELINLFQKEFTKIDLPNAGKTSVNLSYIHGGTLKVTQNGQEISGLGMIVPNYAEINCEIRVGNPKITPKYIQNQLNQIAKNIGIKVNNFNFKFYLGSMLTPKSKLKNFENTLKDLKQKVEYADISLSGFYEVQLLQEKWNSDCLIFGPGPIAMSHAVDEYADIDSIVQAEKVIKRYIEKTV